MKLILTRDVQDLGRSGQVVNVADGYARNFLLPRKLAIQADAGALAAIDRKRKVIEIKGEKLAAEAQEVAAKINDLQVTISEKAGSGTKLYGSVTSQEIADALLAQHKVSVDKRKIHIAEPIKSTGVFEVPIRLHHDVSATIKVEVVAQVE